MQQEVFHVLGEERGGHGLGVVGPCARWAKSLGVDYGVCGVYPRGNTLETEPICVIPSVNDRTMMTVQRWKGDGWVAICELSGLELLALAQVLTNAAEHVIPIEGE